MEKETKMDEESKENNHEPINNKKNLKFYEDLRKKLSTVVEKYSGKKGEKFLGYLLSLPDFFVLLCRLAADKRVSKTQKAFIGAIIAYLIIPLDIIPDFIPVIGYVDDLVLVVFGLNLILNELDRNIILENWSGDEDVIALLSKITLTAEQFMDKNILSKIKSWINKKYK